MKSKRLHWEEEDRREKTGLMSAGRACVKRDVLGEAARRTERKRAGWGGEC